MNVTDTLRTSPIHSIEWGEATWDPEDISIRNRYDNASGGRYNHSGSSEVPWEDFKIMILESIRRNHLNNIELGEIMDEIATRLKTL